MNEPLAKISKKMNVSRRCPRCSKLLRYLHLSDQKIIYSLDDAAKISQALRKSVAVGDSMCKKCYMIMYKNKEKTGKNQSAPVVNAEDAIAGCSQGCSSDSPVSSQPFSQSSTESNPSYVPPVTKDEEEIVVMPFLRTLSTHKYCFLCRAKTKLVNVPIAARLQIFANRKIYVPHGNRCCSDHLVKDRFYKDEIEKITAVANECNFPKSELTIFMEKLSSTSIGDSGFIHAVADFSLSEEKLKVFTGLSWENLQIIQNKLSSMRNSHTRNVTQALVTFLFKLRTGASNEVISAVLGLEGPQYVSKYCDSILNSFEQDILPNEFGFSVYSRDFLITNTAPVADALHNIGNKLALICDGTYIHHQKSTNNFYQRKSYSGQKKKPLCKPFTICTTNGFVVDLPGPFYGTQNDAQIMKIVMSDKNGLQKLLQPGDIFILDRGFRDVKDYLENKGFQVLMPALKGKRKQLSTAESNESRKTTKVRWPIEALHGVLGKKYRLLHEQVDNKLLPKIGNYARIACYLNNKFGKRFNSDRTMVNEIVEHMEMKAIDTNDLAKEVEEKRLNQRKTLLTTLHSNELMDFPEMTEEDLTILFTGTYQLKQAVGYLAEMIDENNCVNLKFVRDAPNIIRFEVRSRHINSRTYRLYVKYISSQNGVSGVLGYCCECPNGLRTVGCCSHVAAVIYYLSHGRYTSKVIKPAEILSSIFRHDEAEIIINDDSDED